MSNNRFVKSQASIDNIQRSAFNSLSHSVRSSLNVGELIPFMVLDVLPGDTINVNTNFVGRLQTPIAPTMDNLIIEYFYFFVANRLVWNNWKYFMGESKSAWLDNVKYRIPHKTLGDIGTIEPKSFLDYCRIPPLAYDSANKTPINFLYRRGYDLIYNEWFRDQNLQDPLLTYESLDVPSSVEIARNRLKAQLLKTNKKHDYFTSCLPAPQKGPSVYIPFSDIALPVLGDDINHDDAGAPVKLIDKDLAPVSAGALGFDNAGTMTTISDSSFHGQENVVFNNLWAKSSYDGAITGAPTINALRFAFQVQKIYEKDARSGTRYVEMIRSHFGVISPDGRQQRPEFLGGGAELINIQQQVATSAGQENNDDNYNILGQVGAFSYTNHSKHGFKHSFTEHGFVIGLATLRIKHTYTQGVPKHFTRLDRFDYYDPALAHLGEQPVMKSEIFQNTNGAGINNAVFGYNEAWADYRYIPSGATANMRPDSSNLGYIWTYADNYSSVPSLSASWIQEDPSSVERTLYLSSSVVDNFFFDMYLDIHAIRPMPLYSIPGLIDHF